MKNPSYALWAIVDVAVDHIGPCHGMFWIYRTFMGSFGPGYFGLWAVLVFVVYNCWYICV